MPVTTTYPGIYIEEVLSNSHTIQAAPTSVTVFVGYTHPFKTQAPFETAQQIFSFSDYERLFGGLFSVSWLSDDVGQAVYDFFLNGGSNAHVVGLLAEFGQIGATATTPILPPTLNVVDGSGHDILFTGLEPTDDRTQITVSIANIDPTTQKTADVVIAFGTTTETYRGVSLDSTDTTNWIEARIGTTARPKSSLVSVSTHSGTWPSTWPTTLAPTPLAQPLGTVPYTTYHPADFSKAFEQDGSLDKVAVFNLLLTPGVSDNPVVSEALAFCERKRAFMILDSPADAVADATSAPRPTIESVMTSGSVIPLSQNGALYFPYLLSADPQTGDPISIPPSGSVAGIFAKEDQGRGVWKAPAGYETVINGVPGVVASGRMTDPRQGTLNPIGVNCVRDFQGIGRVVFGARTLVSANPSYQQYRYVPVRRMALFLEQSLYGSLGWVIFEPNDTPLWTAIRTTIESFMLGLFNEGAFQGKTPSEAFQVQCDRTTTTPEDQANGVVNIVVAFAPLKPAEFVVIKLAQLAGQPQS